MKQKCSTMKSIVSLNNIKSKQEVIAQIYFETASDKLDSEDKVVLDKVAKALETLNLRIGCVADAWIIGGADHRGSPQYNLDLGKRRAKAVRKYIESKGFLGGLFESRSVGESNAAQPKKDRGVYESQLAVDRRVDILLVLSIDEARIAKLEKLKEQLWKLLREAKAWESIRSAGPLSMMVPGDMTANGIQGVVDWVKPKNSSVGSAFVAAGKAPLAAIAIMVSTPVLLLTDTVISAYDVARRTVGAAPQGAYLPIGKEREIKMLMDKIYHEINALSTCQVKIHEW